MRVSPPSSLPDARRELWRREFDRFPLGYFVPADVSAMLLYLQWIEIHDEIFAALAAAQGVERPALIAQLRLVDRTVITLQRALRMFPSTRSHVDAYRNLATDPVRHAVLPGLDGEPEWRRMMREAGAIRD